jgi:hypothetical protein
MRQIMPGAEGSLGYALGCIMRYDPPYGLIFDRIHKIFPLGIAIKQLPRNQAESGHNKSLPCRSYVAFSP